MSYLVNGEEFSTKKDATDALFAAAQSGDATLSIVSHDDSDGDHTHAEEPHAGMTGGPAEAAPVIL